METISRTKARQVVASEFGRYRQLALAYLIGMPYRRVEFTTREGNEAGSGSIASVVHPGWWKKPKAEQEALLEEIRVWLSTEASPELVKKHEDARAAFFAAKKANTERILAERAAE